MKWNGINDRDSLAVDLVDIMDRLSDAAKYAEWSIVYSILEDYPALVNAVRAGVTAMYTPLHQAAFNCPDDEIVDVANKLLGYGASRLARTSDGKTPLEVRRARFLKGGYEILEPDYIRQVDLDTIYDLQTNFDDLLQFEMGEILKGWKYRIPRIERLLEMATPSYKCIVPGYLGDVTVHLDVQDISNATLQVLVPRAKVIDCDREPVDIDRHYLVTRSGFEESSRF